MTDPTTGSNPASQRALEIARHLAEPDGLASVYLTDFRTCLQDLIGHPLGRGASRALTETIYRLDALEASCQRLLVEIRCDSAS